MTYLGEFGVVTEAERSGDMFSNEWRISCFVPQRFKYGDHFCSPYFDSCGAEWCLELHPIRESGSNWMRLFLYRMDDGPPMTLNTSVGIRGREGAEKRKSRTQEFTEDDYICVWQTFCKVTDFSDQDSGLLHGSTLVIVCDMKTMTPDYVEGDAVASICTDEVKDLSGESHSAEKRAMEELQNSFRRLLKSEEDCDVVLKVQDKEFRAHRSILRARSPVFQAMFDHDMLEKQRGVATMDGCDPESFPAFLEHIYTGCIGMVNRSNVFSLYAASDMYDLDTLKKECANFMTENMTVESFCDAIALAVRHDEKELIERATEFFYENTLDIVKTVEWQAFLKENSTVGNELFIKFLMK